MKKFSLVTVRKRNAMLLLLFTAIFTIITLKLFYLDVIMGDRLFAWALDQRRGAIPILADRGDILDRNLTPLAVSMSTDAVYAIPAEVEDVAKAAADLAPLLDLDYDWLVERLSRKQRMVWLKLRVDPDTAKKVRELKLDGIDITVRPQRFYPHDQLAAHVIGFAGIENQGLEGLEKQYEQYLKGIDGMLLQERDATGRVIPGAKEQRIAPLDGHDLVLTIDHVIQYIAERELARAVVETQSEAGMILLVQPQTGEILASAVYPTFNPNDYQAVPAEYRRNRIFTDIYEPGSTFKVVTGAAALETGVVTLDETFVDPVHLNKWGGWVNCWRSQGHGVQTFVEATENSCNPVFAILAADRLGPKNFYKYITGFGFGEKTGIDFPGERSGLVPKPGEIKHGELLQWANIGFGQGVAVTALQMAMMVSAIANKGKLMKPRLVKEIRDRNGRVVESFQPEMVRQVISEATAMDFAKVMRSVVVNGSGARGEVPGYRVAGKTGTAQIPAATGGYSDDRVASFIGFAPVDDPQIAGIVVLYKIGVRPAYGGTWAAPVFSAVVGDALEYLGVERLFEEKIPVTPGQVFVPNVVNLPKEEALEMLRKARLEASVTGSGQFVEQQFPKPGAEVPPGTKVHLAFFSDEGDAEMVVVPDVRGTSLRDAAVELGRVGLVIVVEGSGMAKEQVPPPGTLVPKGERVYVKFALPQ
ncbi:MAG TPA: PASTA domain-containing protein [Firmicutes bacterium]|nr:PASTA domain-containing protein [Bacillota bacterium]